MQAFSEFKDVPSSFWSLVKFISETLGYTDRKTKLIKTHSADTITQLAEDHHINIDSNTIKMLEDYFSKRASLLNDCVQHNLMNAEQAKALYEELLTIHKENGFHCKLPMNKQSGEMKKINYFTAIINILTEKTIRESAIYDGSLGYDDDPRGLVYVLDDNTKRIPEKLEPYAVVSTSEAYRSTKMEDSGEWNVKDKEKALAYMAQANYDGTPIVYLTSNSNAFYNGAMAIIPMMESIGLNVELMVVDSGSHSAIRKDPAGGHDIGCWEVQKNEENPVLHSTFVTGTQGWWSSPAKEAAIATMKSTPTGSPESVAAYNDYLDAVIDECPYILFGHPIGQLAQRDNVVRDTVGQRNYYYWNTYFSENPRKK